MSTSSQGAKFEYRKRDEDRSYRVEYWHEYYILDNIAMPMRANYADFIVAHDEEVIYTCNLEPEEVHNVVPQYNKYEVRYIPEAHMKYWTLHGYSQFVVARMQGVI